MGWFALVMVMVTVLFGEAGLAPVQEDGEEDGEEDEEGDSEA